ncbi:LLM class flavin-dependent oxidoreductase [Leifsonia shinshuensis]|uniref:LLM class flavin-dependent oxidoreductase n=1 Tax=Leifsonia shinshuensis TaxID=150026 RepID=A0A7G6YGQ2_9MICO|nr:LLM class flavin-dependent oxidoreductase [Leifsonia shinshuensis]QNE37667.1 LLM class flavin-dependent oxidoreductase [Leifsonia shinshuensis]
MRESNRLSLSVLDLVPVRGGQTSAQAFAASLQLVSTAEAAGFTRYWFAEHHNLPAVASTSPAVLVAASAGRTRRIRLGSGGVMLPNHSPLIVAEQFATLEALAPGRIDLGLGRAPGSDPVISQLLRMSGTSSDVEEFPDHVRDIVRLMTRDGITLDLVRPSSRTGSSSYEVRATPSATTAPEVWLLGSSDRSARLAAAFGLPFVFANHLSGNGSESALDLYRTHFRPTATQPHPRTFATANVIAATTATEAEERALPELHAIARLRLNLPLTPLESVEQATESASEFDEHAGRIMSEARATWFIGTGETVSAGLRAFAARLGVDEVMISPVAGAYRDERPTEAPGRVRTLELLGAPLSREPD